MPPPLLLLSDSLDPKKFIGVLQNKNEMSGRVLRDEHSQDVKALMNKKKSQWGSHQILNWIDSNLETGRSENYNIEDQINRDVN